MFRGPFIPEVKVRFQSQEEEGEREKGKTANSNTKQTSSVCRLMVEGSAEEEPLHSIPTSVDGPNNIILFANCHPPLLTVDKGFVKEAQEGTEGGKSRCSDFIQMMVLRPSYK